MPIDEFKERRAIERAAQAEALLGNELYQEAFKVAGQLYMKAWAETEPHETQARENYWRAFQILPDVERHLKRIVESGKVSKAQLNKLGDKFAA